MEQEKSLRNKGSYLHPDLYGMDKSKSIHPKMKSKTKEEIDALGKSAQHDSNQQTD